MLMRASIALNPFKVTTGKKQSLENRFTCIADCVPGRSWDSCRKRTDKLLATFSRDDRKARYKTGTYDEVFAEMEQGMSSLIEANASYQECMKTSKEVSTRKRQLREDLIEGGALVRAVMPRQLLNT